MASNSATLRQPAPSPVLRLLWLGTPLPNLPVRAPAADAFTEVLLTDFTAGCCEPSLAGTATAVLLMAAPDHCGPPGAVVSPVAVLQPLWLRNSTTAPSCELQLRTAARQFISAGPLLISATTKTLTTPSTNVYSGGYRFSCAGRRGTPPRPVPWMVQAAARLCPALTVTHRRVACRAGRAVADCSAANVGGIGQRCVS